MKNIKILLTDLRHSTVGAHSNYVPIGIGYIASYLKEKVKEANIYSSKHFFKLINYHVLFSDGFGVTLKPGQKPTKNS